jgi:hypothetical protein
MAGLDAARRAGDFALTPLGGPMGAIIAIAIFIAAIAVLNRYEFGRFD